MSQKTPVAEIMIDMVTIRPGRTGGAERYVTELFPRLERDPRLVLKFVAQPAARSLLQDLNIPGERVLIVAPKTSGPVGLLHAKSQVRRMVRQLKLDAVFSPFNQPVLAPGIPEALTVHDLSSIFYLKHAGELGISRIERTELKLRLRRSLAGISQAAVTVVPSASVKAAIMSMLPLPTNRIHVVHLGGDANEIRLSDRWTKSALSERRVLGVMSGAPHKNLQLLRTVAEQVEQEGVRFGIVGRSGVEEAVAGDHWPRNVEFLGSVSDKALAELMRTSSCLFAPSRFEGFGLPLAEAMHVGLPMLVSDIPPHREILGDVAEYFDPLDSTAAALRLIRLLETLSLAAAMSDRLLQRATSFTWRACAEAHGNLLADLAHRTSSP